MDTLPGGVQQLQPGLGQGLGRRAAGRVGQVLGDALHQKQPAGGRSVRPPARLSAPTPTPSMPPTQRGCC